MSEKVKLTGEQAEEISQLKKSYAGDYGQAVQQFSGTRFSNYVAIDRLTVDEFVRALYIGYEVEETFEVGDWVHNNVTGRVAKIDDRGYDEEVAWVDDDKVNFFTQFRHATPEEIAEEKQRRWWAKHGREVWELKENDLLYYDDEFKEVEEVSEIGAIMLSSERVYLPLETIKSKYSVACFAEDRKDINGGDIE